MIRAAQNRRPHIAEAGLLLRMNADVIAVDISRWMLGLGGIELKSDPPLELFLEVARRPTMPQEEKLQPRPLAVFAQLIGVAKQLGDSLDHRQNLIPAHERIQRRTQVRLGGKSAAHAQAKTNLRLSLNHALGRSQADIVDLRVGAPDAASRDRDLELARQVVELGIARQHSIRFQRERRSIADLVRVHAGDRAARNVARHIAAGARRVQADAPEFLEHFRKSLDRDPVQLNVLPHREIGDAAGVAAGEVGDGSQLVRSQQAVGNANSHHEERQRQSLAVLAANHSHAVALRVDAPPAEVGSNPLRRNRS